MKEIVRINCRTKKVSRQPEGETFNKLGGRGLISYIMLTETDAKTNPMGSGNKLIFAGMLIAGTSIPTVNRLSIGGKSPLTGGIKEANVGGNAGASMASHGIKALIFEELPQDNTLEVFVVRKDGTLVLDDGGYLRGKGTYETTRLLYEKYGEKISVIVNGVAGERGYANSSIQVSEHGTGYPCRAAARGGLGAVMGSKGIKAIVFEKADKAWSEYADKALFDTAKKEVVKSILESKSFLSEMGTMGFVAATVPSGIIPVRNFSGQMLTEEQCEKFNVGTITDRIRSYGGKTGHACQAGCIVQCSNIINDEQGNFITGGFEYETLGLFGPNCDIYDMDPLVRMDRFCDDFGFDTIETGDSFAVYMDAGKIPWGDSKSVLEILNSFWAEDNPLASEFGQGTAKLGEKYGVKKIPTVKGQSLAAYEPRNIKGTATTYALSPMGADHTCGSSLGKPGVTPTGREGQVDCTLRLMASNATCDCNVCLLSWASISKAGDSYANAVNGVLGYNWTFEDLLAMGSETVERERAYNKLAGFTEKDDRLPDYFYSEATTLGNVYDIPQLEIDEKWYGAGIK